MLTPARIAVLVSGGGTNLQALLDAQRDGKMPHGEIVLVVSSRAGAYALTRAENAGVAARVLTPSCGQEPFENELSALLREHGIEIGSVPGAEAQLRQGCTVIYLAVDGRFAGFLTLSDTLRAESAATIAALSALGVQPVLLTGDHENTARAIAEKLHIREVRSGCLPEDKLNCIDAYQRKAMPVCMIGDGVNDAPALKKADVGIAVGGVGSDIAVDAADIALVDDEVRELPHLVALSKRMMTTIKCNMIFSMTLNFIAITLAIIGTLNPVVGALVHNAGSVLVIVNSAFLL